MKKENPLVSVIVPTYNSEKNLKNLLDSFLESEYKNFEIIVNDDKKSQDDTKSIVQKYTQLFDVIYIDENIKMAQGRKSGANHAKGEILIHLDSDMKITKGLIGEIVELMKKYDALIVPEICYGTTFWAECKGLEKKCYAGVREMESLRVVKRFIYEKLGGHDERMVFGEDRDLNIRVEQGGYKIGYVKKNFLRHNEGHIELWKTCIKKMGYCHTASIFSEKHPKEYRWQINILNRYRLYLRNIKYLFSSPLVYIGMIYMKTSEYFFGFIGLLRAKIMK